MCEMYGLPIVYSGDETNDDVRQPATWTEKQNGSWSQDETLLEDKVILETEITLRSGPNITMKIHEESRSNSAVESEEDTRKMGVIRVLTEDSESDFHEEARKTPRKVRFGGEQVKMRTPESDSSNHTDNEEHNIPQIIDLTTIQHELSSIKITAVSIKTKKSHIPIRVTSLPSSPVKQLNLKRNLHKSTPNLTSKKETNYRNPTRIPRIRRENPLSVPRQRHISESSNNTKLKPLDVPTPQQSPSFNRKQTVERSKTLLSPVPVHKEVEMLHNLTRSPERSRQNSAVDESNENIITNDETLQIVETVKKTQDFNSDNNNYSSFQIVNAKEGGSSTIEDESSNNFNENIDENTTFTKLSYCSFHVCNDDDDKKNYNETSVVIEEITDEKDDDNAKEDNVIQSSLQRSVSSLTSDDELWAKSEALESVVKMLKEPETCMSLEPGPASLLFEALFASHHRDRLHSLADQALGLLVEGLKEEVLQQCLPRVAAAVCKMGAPSGVRLAIATMKKCPPRSFQNEVLERGLGHRSREGALQVLLACARIFPSTDVEVQRITDCAVASLKDRRRKVRHAALEILAAIAQLVSNMDVLSAIEKVLRDYPEKKEILQVVRARLSRKQLPTVESDGSIRYATPVDPIELEWLSGTTFKQASARITNKNHSATDLTNENIASSSAPNKMTSTNGNDVLTNRNSSACSGANQKSSSTPSSSASTSTRSVNYWVHNSRRDALYSRLPTIGLNDRDENFHDHSTSDHPVIWALDPAQFTKQQLRNTKGPLGGVLRPVYILQQDSVPTVNGRGYRRYDRGRSFSPPTRRKNQNGYKHSQNQTQFHMKNKDRHRGSWQNLEEMNRYGSRENETEPRYHKERFQNSEHTFKKSFSSDQLYNLDKQQETRKSRVYDPHSYSLSSNSSTTSTGSSSRIPSYWHKDFKSGIPISTERFRIRTSQKNHASPAGPMVALRSIPSSTPPRLPQNTPPRQENGHLPPPPRSSGSESSGYFTPTPGSGGDTQRAFVKVDTEESREEVSSDEVDHMTDRNRSPAASRRNSKEFEDANPRVKTPNVILEDLENNNKKEDIHSPKSTPHEKHFGELLTSNYSTTQQSNDIETRTSSRNTPISVPLILAGTTNEIVPVKRKSKSVAELQNFLPEIHNINRKNTNSAPARKTEEDLKYFEIDINDNVRKADDNVFDDIRQDVLNAKLCLEKKEEESANHQSAIENDKKSSRLERRFTSNSKKSVKSTPPPKVTPEPILMKPYAKPKDALQLSLNQMESSEWETTIQGLHSLLRLAKHHSEVVDGQIHTVCISLAKHIKNLRSQVARVACQTAAELFITCKRGLDVELDEIAGPLLQRTADTNKFLRADANAALDQMCDHLPLHRVIPVITIRGCSHQNAVVRAASMRLLCKLVNALGADKVMHMAKELRDKLILAGATALTDGNLEARHQAKAMFGVLMGYPGFQRVLNEVVPHNLLRHIAKTMATLK